MKKYISIVSLLVVFFFGVQTTQAQQSKNSLDSKITNISKQQAIHFFDVIAVNKNQKQEIYNLFYSLNKAYVAADKQYITTLMQAESFSFNPKSKAMIKEILNEEQYKKLDSYLQEN